MPRIRIRYLTLKLRALCWVLRRLRAGWDMKCFLATEEMESMSGETQIICSELPFGKPSNRTARREYGSIGTVHLFMAAPAGIAVLVGQLLNTLGAVQTYEHLSIDGSGRYKPAALLRPCV